MRHLVFAALLAPSADAQDTASWGLPVEPTSTRPNTARLELCDGEDCFARVVVLNTLISQTGSQDFGLEIEGLRVQVDYNGAAAMEADTVTVTPPPGYFAEPEVLTLEENEAGVIRIHLAPLS